MYNRDIIKVPKRNRRSTDMSKKRANKNNSVNNSVDAYTNNVSDSVRVLKTLTFGEKGNIIVDKEASEKAGERVLADVSKVVGYLAKNIGKKDLTVRVYEYSKDADGMYNGEYVDKVWKAGTEMAFNKPDLMYLASREEFSFAFENGTICHASSINKAIQRIKDGDTSVEAKRALLNGYCFKFSDKRGVNDPYVTLRIDDNKEVKEQYLSAFGWLANKKVRKTTKNTTRDKQIERAAELRKLLELTAEDIASLDVEKTESE